MHRTLAAPLELFIARACRHPGVLRMFVLNGAGTLNLLATERFPLCRKDAAGKLQHPWSSCIWPHQPHHTHEEAVAPNPCPSDSEDQEEAELGKELQRASEEHDGCED